jgi:hypothetical protein
MHYAYKFAAKTLAPALMFGAVSLLAARPAEAQLNSDIGLRLGVEKRFLTGRGAAPDATPGPDIRLEQHFALFPLIRAGFYGSYSFAFQSSLIRHQMALGAQFRVFAPIPLPRLRLFLNVGTGVLHIEALRVATGTEARGFRAGNCLDVPVDVGVSYRIKKPWEFGAQLGPRFAAFCGGRAYDNGAGKDTITLSAAVTGSVEF